MRSFFLIFALSVSAFAQSPSDHESLYPTVTNFAEETDADPTLSLILAIDPGLVADTAPPTPRQQANEWLQQGESEIHVAIDMVFLDFLKKNPQRLREFGQLTVDKFVDQYFFPPEDGGGLRPVPKDGDPFGPRFAPGTTREQVEMYYARSLRYFLTVKDLEDAAAKGIDKAKEMAKALRDSGMLPALKAVLMPTIPNLLYTTQIPY